MTIDAKYIDDLLNRILPALRETLFMVSLSSLFSILIGMIMGVMLYVTAKNNIMENKVINNILGTIVNIGRSVPFVILMVAVFPLSKIIVGTSIGSVACIVPLTVAAAPFVARVIESALMELDKGVIEASQSMGASELQIIFKVMLPEAAPSIVSGITITIINIIGYSAMAGTIGGGGLGDVAIRYGYQKFRNDYLWISVIIMVILVQIIQLIGNIIAKKLNKKA